MMRTRALMTSALLTMTMLSACSHTGTGDPSRPGTGGVLSALKGAAGLPTKDSVRDGRFVKAVQLDKGLLRVDPAPATMTPSISEQDASDEIWASPAVSGVRSGMVLGFGLVTTLRGASNVPLLTAAPAWIGFAWGGVYNCPAMSGSVNLHPHLPSNGYVAVVLGANGAPPDLTYTARSSICGGPPMGPKIATATQVLSVAWHQVGDLSGNRLTLRYTLPGCGRPFSIGASGNRTSTTVGVDAVAPDEALPCVPPTSKTQTIDLAPGGSPSPGNQKILHAKLGLVRQIQTP